MRAAPACIALIALACSRPPAPAESHPESAPTTSSSIGIARPATAAATSSQAGADTAPDAAAEAARAERAAQALSLPAEPSCQGELRCTIEHAYAGDAQAKAMALALFDETGDVAGTDHEQTMDGGFRGTLHLLPRVPTGASRPQLARVLAAARDFDAFFADLFGAGAAATSSAPTYRWRGLTFRFFESKSGPAGHEVDRTTPSAYAMGPRPAPRGAADDIGYSLGYNVRGSLLTTDTGVRETLFHEVFHMNDDAHHDWSVRVLSPDYQAIVKRCGAMNVACLRPYAPNDTMVRGGTFYAFEPNNGMPVREYAAELALRWYKEHRALWKDREKQPAPGRSAFKCGPPENGRAWAAIVKEFFSGVDRIPACH
jgi:hypothetical protein